MDVRAERISPLPESDYTKTGKLKALRGRMLKKLLKYEFRYLLPTVLIGVGILLVSAVLLSIQIAALTQSAIDTPLFIMSIGLYAYANIGVLILAIAMGERRLYNNFFKSEGALTFSLPATAEEHIFAKHIATLVCSLISLGAVFVGALILLIGGGKEFSAMLSELSVGIGEFFASDPLNVVLFFIEGVISMIFSFVGVPCILGALTVFLRKFSGKKKGLALFLIIIAVNGVSNLLLTAFLVSGLPEVIFQSLVGVHIVIWIAILLQAALIGLCLFYEIYVLKKKLNV